MKKVLTILLTTIFLNSSAQTIELNNTRTTGVVDTVKIDLLYSDFETGIVRYYQGWVIREQYIDEDIFPAWISYKYLKYLELDRRTEFAKGRIWMSQTL